MARTREFDLDEATEQIARQFWADGYEATGISDLEGATGLGRGSLYGAFGSKREMLDLAIRWYTEGRLEQMISTVEQGGLEGAKSLFRMFSFAVQTQPEMASMGCMVINTSVELGTSDPKMNETGEQYRARFREAFRTALAHAEAEGEIGGPIEPKVEVATLMLLGLFVAVRGGSDLAETDQLVEGAVGVLDSWKTS